MSKYRNCTVSKIFLCDRIMVICGGRVTGIVDGRSVTKEEIGILMTRSDVASSTESEKEEPNRVSE